MTAQASTPARKPAEFVDLIQGLADEYRRAAEVWADEPEMAERYTALAERNQADADRRRAEPRAFTIVNGWDVTQAHGAPNAHTYGQCQSAASLARCMGSRVSYTEVDGATWRMERQEGGTEAVWVAVDVTAVRQFDLMGR